MKPRDPLLAEEVRWPSRVLMSLRGRIVARTGLAALASVVAVLAAAYGPSGTPPGGAVGPGGAARKRPDGPALAFPLSRLVPPDALAFVSVADVPDLLERASETGLARAMRDERVAPFVGEVVACLPAEVAGLCAVALTFLRGLGPALRGEAAAALLDVEAREGEAGFEAVFLADVSGRSAEARGFLGAALTLRFVTGSVAPARIGGVDAVVYRSGSDTVAWCESDGLLAIATSLRALEKALARRPTLKDAPPGIASLPAFKRGMEGSSLEGIADYRAFVDVDGLLERLPERLPGKRAADLRAEYWIGGLRAAALAGRVGESFREALFLDAGDGAGARAGIFRTLGGPPVALRAASRLPAETMVAAFGHLDGRDLAKRLSGPRALRSAPRTVSVLLGVLGRESARQVLGGVRGEAAVAAWNDGHVGWFLRMAAVATVIDRAATERTLKTAWRAMATRLKGRFLPRRGQWSGDTSREVSMGFVDRPEIFNPVLGSPAYGLDGDTLVAGTAATAVRGIIEESEGLAATERFRSLLAVLPAERSAFVYVNVETLVERALEPLGPAWLEKLVPGSSRRLDREKLPPGEAVAKYLGPAGVSSMRSRGGVRVDAVTPMGLAAALLVADALARPPAKPAP